MREVEEKRKRIALRIRTNEDERLQIEGLELVTDREIVKKMTNLQLKDQLAKLRPSDTQIPKISKILRKEAMYNALVEALDRMERRTVDNSIDPTNP